jgi:hypothetical protein
MNSISVLLAECCYNGFLTEVLPIAKPMDEHESQISEIYHSKLSGLFEKIKP